MCPPWATLSLRSASEIWRCVQLLPLHLLAEAGRTSQVENAESAVS